MSYTLFDHKRNEGILEELRAGSSTSWQETKKKQMKLAATHNKNEEQDAKKNWIMAQMNTTVKTSKETLRQGQSRSIKA